MVKELTLADLDRALWNEGCDSRIEASFTLAEVLDDLDAEAAPYVRNGLGEWRAFTIDVEGYGLLHIAAPTDEADAGCSVWFKSSDVMNGKVAATLLYALSDDAAVQFLNPESGELVVPDLHLLQPSEKIGDHVSYSHPNKEQAAAATAH